VGHKLLKLEVVVDLVITGFGMADLLWRNVEIQMLWVLTKSGLQICEVNALSVEERILVEVVEEGEAIAELRVAPDQIVDDPLVGLCGDEDCAGDFVELDLAHDAAAFLLLHGLLKILALGVGEHASLLADSLLLEALDALVDFFGVARPHDEVKHLAGCAWQYHINI